LYEYLPEHITGSLLALSIPFLIPVYRLQRIFPIKELSIRMSNTGEMIF